MSRGTADRVLGWAMSHLGDGEDSEDNPGEFVMGLRAGAPGKDQWSAEFAAYCLLKGGALESVTPSARKGAKKLARHLGRVGVGTVIENPRQDMQRGDIICWNATDKPLDYRAVLAIVDRYDTVTETVAVVMGAVGRPGRRTVQRLVLHAEGGAGWTNRLHSVHRPDYEEVTW